MMYPRLLQNTELSRLATPLLSLAPYTRMYAELVQTVIHTEFKARFSDECRL